ncbi:MAG: hypothetical protein QM733_22545 [Ilumatobacteraceae bacterium]
MGVALTAITPSAGAAPVLAAGTQAAATASLASTSTTPGGTLSLSGANWLHPSGGGSTIAIKIDDGAYAHAAGETVHANATIWQIVEADADGSFDVQVTLPATITTGTHNLRLLTGSLKANDEIRTMAVDFTVVSDETSSGSSDSSTGSGSTSTGSGSTRIVVEVPATGGLTISVAAPSVALSAPVLQSGNLVSTGALPTVTVIDLRSGDPGWNVTGQVTDFVSGANTIDADQLGWTPSVTSSSDGQAVKAGTTAAPGSGLGTARQLAAAQAGSGRGTAVLGAALTLAIPTAAKPGTYGADLTLTVI